MKRSLLQVTIGFFVVLSGLTHAGEVIMVPSPGIRSISQAIVKAQPGDTILVSSGKYKEHLFVKSGVIVKAKYLHKTVVDGDGRGTVITLGSGSGIEGLVVQNGTIGVFCKDPDASIRKCRIQQNWMTGIITVRNLPTIEDNIIAFNRSSGIVGWNVRSTKSAIEHNTLAYNGGFGLYLGGTSDIQFKYNTVAFNQKFGIQTSKESTESIIKFNNLWENLRRDTPESNYAFDPAFNSPKVGMDFTSNSTLCCTVKDANGENLGARTKN